MKTMTIKTAKDVLATAGLSIKNKGGKLCVNFKPGFEQTAYYTTSLDDAVATGLNMIHRRTMDLINDLNEARRVRRFRNN